MKSIFKNFIIGNFLRNIKFFLRTTIFLDSSILVKNSKKRFNILSDDESSSITNVKTKRRKVISESETEELTITQTIFKTKDVKQKKSKFE